jgi:hypothetical protein
MVVKALSQIRKYMQLSVFTYFFARVFNTLALHYGTSHLHFPLALVASQSDERWSRGYVQHSAHHEIPLELR